MASSVATPLERQFGRIAGINEMTSTSILGSTSISLQFDLEPQHRRGRARCAGRHQRRPQPTAVEPSAESVLPQDQSGRPAGHDAGHHFSDPHGGANVRCRPRPLWRRSFRRSQGVGQVSVGGASLPAVRVDVNPMLLNNYGVDLEDVRAMLRTANVNPPKGALMDDHRSHHAGHHRPAPEGRAVQTAGGALQQDRRRRAAERRGQRHRFGGEPVQLRHAQRQAVHPAHHLPAAGRQHGGDPRPRGGRTARAAGRKSRPG